MIPRLGSQGQLSWLQVKDYSMPHRSHLQSCVGFRGANRVPQRQEYNKYLAIRDRPYEHTTIYDPNFLSKTSMDFKFKIVLNVMGWQGFWHIHEKGSRLLTMEFLCSFYSHQYGIIFRMFKQDYGITWSQVNVALSF